MTLAASTPGKRDYCIFKGGEVEFRGKKYDMGGKVLVGYPYKTDDPNIRLWERMQKETAEWYESLPVQPKLCAEEQRPALKQAAAWTLLNCPYAKNWEDEATYKKLMQYCKILFFFCFCDAFIDGQEIRLQEGLENFRRLLAFTSEQSYLILTLCYETRDELDAALEKSDLVQKYSVCKAFFACIWGISVDFRNQWKFNSKELDEFARGCQNVFKYMFWLNYVDDLDYLYNEDVRPYLRIHKVSMFPMFEICKLMDGVKMESRMRKEKHLKRLHFLGCFLTSQLNDVLSSKKEIFAGEMDNPVLLDADERENGGLINYSTSLNRHIKVHDDYLEEYGQTYDFLRGKYPADSPIIKFADIISDGTAGAIMFHVLGKDYYKLEFSFESV